MKYTMICNKDEMTAISNTFLSGVDSLNMSFFNNNYMFIIYVSVLNKAIKKIRDESAALYNPYKIKLNVEETAALFFFFNNICIINKYQYEWSVIVKFALEMKVFLHNLKVR